MLKEITKIEDYKKQKRDDLIDSSTTYGFKLSMDTINAIPEKYCKTTVIFNIWAICLDHLNAMDFPTDIMVKAMANSKEMVEKAMEEA